MDVSLPGVFRRLTFHSPRGRVDRSWWQEHQYGGLASRPQSKRELSRDWGVELVYIGVKEMEAVQVMDSPRGVVRGGDSRGLSGPSV